MTLHTLLNVLVFVAATLCAGSYLLRLDAINWVNTRHSVVLFNLAMFGTCGAAMFTAVGGDAGLLEFSSVLGAGLWLHISDYTWGGGQVPQHVQTRPGDLDALEHPQ